MAERDAKLEEFVVDSLLASTVTPKVERFLEEKRKEIVKRYGTDEPPIDVVRQKLHQKQPSQVVDPIEVALELRDAIQAVERRSFVLPLAMFHIGGLLGYFEVCLRKRDVPRSLIEHHRKMVATEDGRKPHEPRLAELEDLLADALETAKKLYEEGEDLTHIELAEYLLSEVFPDLVNEILRVMNPPTIGKKEPKDWTEEDKFNYAKGFLATKLVPIARKYNRVFGDPGVKKSKS